MTDIKRHNERSASNMKFGVIVVREFEEHAERHLMPTVESFLAMGCAQQNILVRKVPSIFDIVVATQFFAEYTDVDAVVILAPENRIMGTLAIMNGLVQLQIQWNMVITVGGMERAEDVVEMVDLQNQMEIEAPEGSANTSNLS